MAARKKRPEIPAQVQRELWARAAGRCEFLGCNDILYKDGLTQKRSNQSNIAHIVAFSADGSRGDPVRSKLLEKDIRNLMLTCPKHNGLIDNNDLVKDYPEELLLEFKRRHEERVRLLTEITEEAQTHIVVLQAPINEQFVRVDTEDAVRAVLPLYPAEENPFVIDLSASGISAENETDFAALAKGITGQTGTLLLRQAGRPRANRLSVFALAPIPLLVHFGRLLGDVDHVDLYQRHRDQQDWKWGQDEDADIFYHVSKPDIPAERSRPIALVLSVTSSVDHNEVGACLGEDALIYEIRARDPGFDFLRSRTRLNAFGVEIRKMLCDLRESHPHEQSIHVFAAVPAPVAIEFGRSVKPFDAPFVIYEYEKRTRTYFRALTVNAPEEK